MVVFYSLRGLRFIPAVIIVPVHLYSYTGLAFSNRLFTKKKQKTGGKVPVKKMLNRKITIDRPIFPLEFVNLFTTVNVLLILAVLKIGGIQTTF